MKVDSRIDASGGLRIASGASTGFIAVSNVNGDIVWTAVASAVTPAAISAATQTEVDNLEAQWRRFIRAGGGMAGATAAAAQILLPHVNTAVTAIAVAGVNSGLGVFHINQTDYQMTGQTTNMRIVGTLLTNAVAPATNFTFNLQKVATFGGASAAYPTVATVSAATASTSTITTPSATTQTRVTSADFAIPAAGYYVLTCTNAGSTAASSNLLAFCDLEYKYV